VEEQAAIASANPKKDIRVIDIRGMIEANDPPP